MEKLREKGGGGGILGILWTNETKPCGEKRACFSWFGLLGWIFIEFNTQLKT